jgi:hypothetical protein
MSLDLSHSKAVIERDAPVAVRRLEERRALAGLVVRKYCWSLSWRGKLLVLGFSVGLALCVFLSLYPFLVVTHRVDTNVLVVEGWVHKYAARLAVEEFKVGSYERVFTTGGPVVGSGGYINDYQTSASVGADLLKKYGLPSESLQMVPSHEMGQDRTYSSALALRTWFRDNNVPAHSFNVLTEDFHARRTRFLYQKAFGKGFTIGIIAVPSPDYDSRHWWRYSDGVRGAIGETIAYLYARFFFRPSAGGK